MSRRFLSPSCCVLTLSFLSITFLTLPACRRADPSAVMPQPDVVESGEPSRPEQPVSLPEPLSTEIEALTGAHTRVVWAHHTGTGNSDPFVSGRSHQLHGIDTRDGLGRRVILEKKNNYSRPLISPDGEQIVFTQKNITRRDDGIKEFDLEMFVTDWKGSTPVKLREGYALDVREESGKVWVYAASQVPPTHRVSWAAKKLIRFALGDPSEMQVIWDKTLISPDNTQWSADGKRASGQTPWPHGGQFVFEDGKADFLPTDTGCWAGMAPDNSYISWMLEGTHRKANLFVAGSEKRWVLRFNQIPGLEKGEIYHPRWSNHPRFVALTGPYLAERSADGSAISKGGKSAEIVIAKLNETVTGFEGRVFLTENQTVDTYPDLWIADGHQQVLSAFPQGASRAVSASSWPGQVEHLVYVWEQVNGQNTVRPADGRFLDGSVEPLGTALFGSRLDMLLADSAFAPSVLVQKHVQTALQGAQNWTFQACLLPHPLLPPSDLNGTLATLPGWRIQFKAGQLHINDIALKHPVLELPAHLAITHQSGKITLTINGEENEAVAVSPAAEITEIRFGGDGLASGLLGVALHTIALDADSVRSASNFWRQTANSRLANPPPRVRVRAKLIETTPSPSIESLDAYTRAMVANLYQIEETMEGEYAEEQILVLHWAVMDSKPVTSLPRQIGESYELIIEPHDVERHHPELKGQRLFGEDLSFELDLWYDLASPQL